MKTNPFKKTLVIGIIILFIGTSIVPSILGTSNTKDDDPERTVRNYDGYKIVSHLATQKEIDEMKNLEGVYNSSKNYNMKHDGYETGVVPSTEKEWASMVGNVSIVDNISFPEARYLPSSIDHSTSPYFPKVGFQYSGSCAAWATTYYQHGYYQARDNNWTNASSGDPDQLMSPAWTYYKVTSSYGSSFYNNWRVLRSVGCAKESIMPSDSSSHMSWGSEDAWRSAPEFRCNDNYYLTYMENIDIIKNALVAGYVPYMFLVTGYYGGLGIDDDTVTSDELYSGGGGHANTIVGYDDNKVADGEVGAFKIVNSWGENWGSSWGGYGYYWMTYDAFIALGFGVHWFDDLPSYQPSLLGVWELDPPGGRDASIRLGGWSHSDVRSPEWLYHRVSAMPTYPSFMCLDITEFYDEWMMRNLDFYLEIGDAQNYDGTITSFTVEHYRGGYTPGNPSKVSDESLDTPQNTPGYVTVHFPLPPVHNIDKDTYHYTIQDGISNASSSDTLKVSADTLYYEGIVIDKSINLISGNRDTTIIDGNGSGDIIQITADDVTIQGFTIRNGNIGVSVQSADNVSIRNNEICNNSLGIYVTGFSNNVAISYNSIYDNIPKQNPSLYCRGIFFENASNCLINYNDIIDNHEGIRIMAGSTDNLICHNNFVNNTQNAFDSGNNDQWDNGYPLGGNYWSDFDEPGEGAYDSYHGESQDDVGSDGIVDLGPPSGGLNPYTISGGYSNDWYALMNPVVHADAQGPYDGQVTRPVQFTGSACFGFPPYTTWHWDFGDGETSHEQNPVHNYSRVGEYIVTLTVTDTLGHISIDTTIAEIRWTPLVYNIDKDRYYVRIGDAIDDASTGDTIQVHNCTYYENIVIDKSITLIGEDRDTTIIDGSETGDVVQITADGVNISGFTIQNSGSCQDNSGIDVTSNYNTVSGNIISDNNYSIYLDSSSNNVISGNNIINNDCYGIHVVEHSSSNIIKENTITNNDLSGIYMIGGPSNNIIKENNIVGNQDYGIKIFSGSDNNRIYHNNFINNSNQAYDEGANIWDDGYPSGGNYWDDFDEPSEGAYDNNSDGIGDIPYDISGWDNRDRYPLMIIYICADANGPYRGAVDEPVQFTGSVYGGISSYSWYWDFGDGNTSTDQHPVHNYTTAAVYTVALTVTDSWGNSDNDTTTVTMKIIDVYAHGPYEGKFGEDIDFIGSATGGFPPYNWSWDFGDDTNSTEQNSTHTYDTADIYTVTLTVTDSNGNNGSETTTATILEPPVHNNDSDTYYWTIQEAVNDADPGDTIHVSSGIYYEHVSISTPINLCGEDRDSTIIDGNVPAGYSGTVVNIFVNGVNISGFTIQNAILQWSGDAGIKISSDYNVISDNNIISNSNGIYLGSSSNDNMIFHNNFISNGYHALDYGIDNMWDNGYGTPFNPLTDGGNYWSNYTGSDNYHGPDQNISGSDGIGDTPYNISGSGSNQDHYPLMAPYSSVDLTITDFSAEYVSETLTSISPGPISSNLMNLTATVKNIGNAGIIAPFRVSFYGINANTDAYINSNQIGTIKIPSLNAGETAEATIYWKLQPEIQSIYVHADSTRVIEESDESNNWASIKLPSYSLWKSLTETINVYTRLSQQYETPSADKVAMQAKKALSEEIYVNPTKYVKTMKKIAELEYEVGIELEGQMPGSLLLHKYQETVKILITVIDELIGDHISLDITWTDAESVAKIQLEICDIVLQMLIYNGTRG